MFCQVGSTMGPPYPADHPYRIPESGFKAFSLHIQQEPFVRGIQFKRASRYDKQLAGNTEEPPKDDTA